jgi:hypothetical protein
VIESKEAKMAAWSGLLLAGPLCVGSTMAGKTFPHLFPTLVDSNRTMAEYFAANGTWLLVLMIVNNVGSVVTLCFFIGLSQLLPLSQTRKYLLQSMAMVTIALYLGATVLWGAAEGFHEDPAEWPVMRALAVSGIYFWIEVSPAAALMMIIAGRGILDSTILPSWVGRSGMGIGFLTAAWTPSPMLTVDWLSPAGNVSLIPYSLLYVWVIVVSALLLNRLTHVRQASPTTQASPATSDNLS